MPLRDDLPNPIPGENPSGEDDDATERRRAGGSETTEEPGMSVNLKSLIGKLNGPPRSTLEAAAGLSSQST